MTIYRSVVGQLNWVAQHTLPEVAYDVSDLSRAFKSGTTQGMRKLTKIVRRVKRSSAEIQIQKLKEKDTYWEVHTDASFGNVEDTFKIRIYNGHCR